jgi:hypothetical protein
MRQLPACVSDRTFRNISNGLALSPGEQMTGAELELDARFRAAEGREEQQERSAGRGLLGDPIRATDVGHLPSGLA